MQISRLSGWGFLGGGAKPPEYIGKSATMASGTGAISVDVPSGYQAGDLFLLLLEGYDAVPATPSGWTDVANDSTRYVYFKVCYKIATASETSVSVADSGNSTRGLMVCFRGVNNTAPVNGYSSITGKDLVAPATTLINCMLVVCVGFRDGDENGTSYYSDWANNSLLSITEGHDQSTNAGSGGGIAFAYGVKELIGSTNNTTVTGPASRRVVITVALSPKE